MRRRYIQDRIYIEMHVRQTRGAVAVRQTRGFRLRCACDADAGGRTSGEREAGHTVLLTGETAPRARAALFEITNLRPAALNRYMLIGLRGKGHPFPRPADSRPGCVGHASVHAFADPVFGGARAPRCVEQHKCGGT